MTGVMLKEQYMSYCSFLQILNNVSIIMLLYTFNITQSYQACVEATMLYTSHSQEINLL